MHSYNIISKSGKGNVYGSVYTITYQVDNETTRYDADVYCLGSENRIGKFCFLESYEYPLIDSKEDRENFINEISEFQKGSSYRKKHPIAMSKLDELYKQKLEYMDKVNEIEKQIETENKTKLSIDYENYLKQIDQKSLDSYTKQVHELFTHNERYAIRKNSLLGLYNSWIIYDKQLDKPVRIIDITRSGNPVFEILDMYDFRKIL